MHVCPQCQSDRLVNNGSVASKRQKLCKPCGYRFTCTSSHGKPFVMKVHAVLLSLCVSPCITSRSSRGYQPSPYLTGSEPLLRSTTRSRNPSAKRSSWSWTRCGATSRIKDRSFESGRLWIPIRGNSSTGKVVDVT